MLRVLNLTLITRIILSSLLILFIHSASAGESICFGTVGNGRIENAVKLPDSGQNFSTYSFFGSAIGRTYLHSKAAEIVISAYHALEQYSPDKIFIYGESGWKNGGSFKPHRTHRNGLSIDFMVPVADQSGGSVVITTGLLNKFGYGLDFDKNGNYQQNKIDFEAIAEHLYQLDIAAKAQNSHIALVIFDAAYLPKLFAAKRGEYLRMHIPFMVEKPWIRHDEHYHVDFGIPCQPMER
jgi:penicillin-insensitive murein DD-endopeptidase